MVKLELGPGQRWTFRNTALEFENTLVIEAVIRHGFLFFKRPSTYIVRIRRANSDISVTLELKEEMLNQIVRDRIEINVPVKA